MKCLPQAKLQLAKGNVLHDWHAEVLAIRAFNRWLVDECADLARKGTGTQGEWLRWREGGQGRDEQGSGVGDGVTDRVQEEERHHEDASGSGEALRTQPFAIHDDVQIHMYCSEAPCGDASMELTIAEQDDATPWLQAPAEDAMLGRGNFDHLGVVRRKPARPDAPVTWSKSCSDKMAMKQCTSLLSGITSLLVHPGNAYLGKVVLPESQCVSEGVERAFGVDGRMKSLVTGGVQRGWREAGYDFRPFQACTTSREFAYSKRAAVPGVEVAPSNLSALYTPCRQEVLINGVLQGRKQFDPKGASCVSRRSIWEAVVGVTQTVGSLDVHAKDRQCSYASLKADIMLEGREKVKRDVREVALKGWKRNMGDEEWSLEP